MVATPDAYRRSISRSSAEIGIAKSGYVIGETGWFSDRSAAYLASGRPVIAQATGLDPRLKVLGLIAFSDTLEAAEAFESACAATIERVQSLRDGWLRST